MHISHSVQQSGHLLLAGGNDARIGMSGSRDAESGRQIQVFFPIGIPNMCAFRPLPYDGPRAAGLDEGDIPRLVGSKQVENFSCAHLRNRSATDGCAPAESASERDL